MDIAKILIDGRSQVIRLPKDYRFEEEEVYRKKTSQGVLLIPKKLNMGYLGEKSNQKTSFVLERNQPESQQEREGLNQILILISALSYEQSFSRTHSKV